MEIITINKNSVDKISNPNDVFEGVSLYENLKTISIKDWIEKTEVLEYETYGLLKDGQIIALASTGDASDYRMHVWKEVMSLYVHPEYKDLKYASVLIDQIVDRKDQRGLENTYVWVLENDQEARDFFELQNIIPNGNRDQRYIDGHQEEFLRYVYVNL